VVHILGSSDFGIIWRSDEFLAVGIQCGSGLGKCCSIEGNQLRLNSGDFWIMGLSASGVLAFDWDLFGARNFAGTNGVWCGNRLSRFDSLREYDLFLAGRIYALPSHDSLRACLVARNTWVFVL
jgi:hypothetical protein